MSPARSWPWPAQGETAAFAHLKRSRERVELHAHEAHQLLVPVGGRLVFHVQGARASVEEPAALVMRAGTPHALEAPGAPVDLFAIQLSPQALAEAEAVVGAKVAFPGAGYLRLARVTPLLRELIHALLFEASAASSPEPSEKASLTYAHLAVTLVDRLTREASAAAEVPSSFRSEYVQRAVAVLTARLSEPVSLPELARQVGTSPRNLSREFQKELGTSPARYGLRLRLEEAARRLWETDAAVKDIALTLGFLSVPRFNTAFRQYKKRTPLEHRALRP